MSLLRLAGYVVLLASTGLACNVPVFRYALERWPADAYRAIVFHRGPLSEQEQEVVGFLDGKGKDSSSPANLSVTTVDLDTTADQRMEQLYERQAGDRLPWMVVLYPASAGNAKPCWSGRLSKEAVQALVLSPVRQELARRILKGETAVWVLVESGDKDQDAAAEKALLDHCQQASGLLRLPEQLDFGEAGASPQGSQSKIPLRISFSVLRVSRSDAEEQVLVSTLLGTESDLHKYAEQPIAFPVYGRGRALYALVGKGLNEENILGACRFITGECSCLAKQQNPGTDILIAMDWDTFIQGRNVVDKVLPPLSGPGDLISATAAKDNESQTPEGSVSAVPTQAALPEEPLPAPQPPAASRLLRNVFLALLGLMAILAGATLLFSRRK